VSAQLPPEVLTVLELLIAWVLITLGLVYLMTRSRILSLPRELLAARSDTSLSLLSCRWCSGYWAGCAAYVYLVFAVDLDGRWFVHTGWAGVAGIGLYELLYRVSPEAAVDAARDLIRPPEGDDG